MDRILVVDDEPHIRKMLTKLLSKEGYRVRQAKNGKECLDLCQISDFDLVITDLIMPEQEGLESIRMLKAKNPDLKIIAISGGGVADPEIYLRFATYLGAASTFVKPVDNEMLVSRVRQLLS